REGCLKHIHPPHSSHSIPNNLPFPSLYDLLRNKTTYSSTLNTFHFIKIVISYDSDKVYVLVYRFSTSLSSSVKTRDLVKNLFPSGPSNENIPPLPSTTSIISCVCFQYSY